MLFNKLFMVIFILSMTMIGGCIIEPYQYISISNATEEEGKAYQTAKLKEVYDLANHKPMPIFYFIDRGTYTVHFELDRTKFTYPAIFITSKQENGGLLYLKGDIAQPGCGRFDKFFEPEVGNEYEGEEFLYRKKLRYRFATFCIRDGHEKRSDLKMIIFQILDEQGILLGEERISFTLKKNGTFYAIDGL